jgi:hypothetical protein
MPLGGSFFLFYTLFASSMACMARADGWVDDKSNQTKPSRKQSIKNQNQIIQKYP